MGPTTGRLIVGVAIERALSLTTLVAARLRVACFLVLLACGVLHAGTCAAEGRVVWGLQAAYGQENAIPRNISHIRMVWAEPQVGIVVWQSAMSRSPMKRFEIVSEGIIGSAVHPGGHMIGDTLMFRFSGNPTKRFVLVFNVSSGPFHTTLNERAPEVGGHVQFFNQGGVGIERRLTRGRFFVAEYRYFHISNAGLTQPNHGFNGSLVSIGMRWRKVPR